MKKGERNKKILYVWTGNKKHQRMGKRVADFIWKKDSGKKIPKNYDVYFITSSFKPVIPILIKKIFNKKTKIIKLFSDPRLYYHYSKEMFDKKNYCVKKYPLWRRMRNIFLVNRLDGILFVGEFQKEVFNKIKGFNKKIPSEVVYTFATKERRKELEKIKPKLNTKNVLFIGGRKSGENPHYKGVDILIEAFKKIKKEIPEARLKLIGNLPELSKKINIEGIEFLGYTEEINKEINNSSLYLHPARGEAFGVTVLEAMYAGVPTIVSDVTGAKEAVKGVKKDFIVPVNSDKVAEKAIKYFKSSEKEKQNLSDKFRKEARKYDEEKMMRLFQDKFDRLLKRIYSKNKRTLERKLK